MKKLSYSSPIYAWFVVALLTLAYVVSYIDRQLMNLMVDPIKADLQISDTQISLLMGLAFGIFYTIMGVPLGRVADRYNRQRLITVGILFWCAMTCACGFARNFVQLFLARLGVGVGEAALSPAALSIISDYFPKEKRTLPLGCYNMGIYVGAAIAMILGGAVLEYLEGNPFSAIPVLGDMQPWQLAFVIVGFPGILVALLMFLIKEPERKEMLAVAKENDGPKSIPIREVTAYLTGRRRTYGSIFVGMGLMSIISYMYFSWVPTMFTRTYDWTIGDVGTRYGLLLLVSGPLGIALGGWIGNRLYSRNEKSGHMRGALLGLLILVPSATLTPLMPTPDLAMAVLFFASLGPGFITANGVAALLISTPNQMRGQVYALFLLVLNLFGLTLGPTSAALVTDFIFGDEAMLRYSIAIVAAIAGLLSFLCFYYGIQRKSYCAIETETPTNKYAADG